MSPEEFKTAWIKVEDNLSPVSPIRLSEFNLQPNTISFLTQVGLPSDAAPFLNFVKDSDEGICRFTSLYGFEECYLGFEKYIIIGNCNDGDVIAINTELNDRIELLDHRNGFEPDYFNSSINKLAASLLAYRSFWRGAQEKYGEDAYFDGLIQDIDFDKVKSELLAIDSHAMEGNNFWATTIEMDIVNRDDFRNESNN